MNTALHNQLKALHEQLAATQRLDAESRQWLLQVLVQASRLLDPDAAAHDDSPVEKMETLAARFDADHPALSAAIRQLMDALAKAGI